MNNKEYDRIITKYFNAVCEAYKLGNVESSYNTPIIDLFTAIGCSPVICLEREKEIQEKTLI